MNEIHLEDFLGESLVELLGTILKILETYLRKTPEQNRERTNGAMSNISLGIPWVICRGISGNL